MSQRKYVYSYGALPDEECCDCWHLPCRSIRIPRCPHCHRVACYRPWVRKLDDQWMLRWQCWRCQATWEEQVSEDRIADIGKRFGPWVREYMPANKSTSAKQNVHNEELLCP